MIKPPIIMVTMRYSGLAGIFVIWSSLLLGMQRSKLLVIDNRPLSYLGVAPKSVLLFSGGLIVSALLFINFYAYIRRNFPISKGFSAAMLIGLVAQIITALVPYYGSELSHRIHTITALTLAFSLPILMWRFAAKQTIPDFRASIYRVLYFELLLFGVGIYLFSFYKMSAPLAQALPAIGYHSWIILVSFYNSPLSKPLPS